MTRPLYAIHKDANGKVLNAMASDWSHEMNRWLQSLDPRPGDTVEFGEKAKREDAVVPAPEAA